MTILVTGGTGLVGPRLLERFVQAGIDCRALVRPGKKLPAGVTAVEGDILTPDSLAAAVQDVSAIVHLAALFRTPDEDQIWRVNLHGTRNLISAAQDHAPDARFLLASTSNVYNPDTPHPGREDDNVHPTLAYPASKIEAEKELRASGLNWAILRLPFIYGDRDGHLEALPGQVASMSWHPAQKLSVVHHEDIATAFELALTGVMDGRTVNRRRVTPDHVRDRADPRPPLRGLRRTPHQPVEGPHGREPRPEPRLPPQGRHHLPGRSRRKTLNRAASIGWGLVDGVRRRKHGSPGRPDLRPRYDARPRPHRPTGHGRPPGSPRLSRDHAVTARRPTLAASTGRRQRGPLRPLPAGHARCPEHHLALD